ncbi:MAG: hypothetical protein M1816_003761 [Peltula sp. TS41687]|nr:MAG: hypothetical protein M1816_003761 [Peltula sp. TS41687]
MDRWRIRRSDTKDAQFGYVERSAGKHPHGVATVASATWPTEQHSVAGHGAPVGSNDIPSPRSGNFFSEHEASGRVTSEGLMVAHERQDINGSGAVSSYPNSASSPLVTLPSIGTPLGAARPSENLSSGREEPLLAQQNSKTGMRKLRLLNPMSLFLRIRSSQGIGSGVQQAGTKYLDFDPRIRGEGIHDFSIRSPQARRDPCAQPHLTTGRNLSSEGPSNPGSDKRAGPTLQLNREDTASKFSTGSAEGNVDGQHRLHSHNQQYTYSAEGADLGGSAAEAIKVPTDISNSPDMVFPTDFVPVSAAGGIAFGLDEAGPRSDVPVRHPSTASQVQGITDLNGNTISSSGQLDEHWRIQPTNIPRHMKSNASSRFSFDLVGVDQEHLLEEKHRKIMSSKLLQQPVPSQSREIPVETGGSDPESDDGSRSISEYSPVAEEPIPLIHEHFSAIDEEGFYYDDEVPRHSQYVAQSEDFSISQELALIYADGISGQDTSTRGIYLHGVEPVTQTPGAVAALSQNAGHVSHEMDQLDEMAAERARSADDLAIIWPTPTQPVLLEQEIDSSLPSDPLPASHPLYCGLAVRRNVPGTALDDHSRTNIAAKSQLLDMPRDESTHRDVPRLEITRSNDVFGKDTLTPDVCDHETEEGITPDDDPMIEAANAEALASDSDGFYGQEFGFYANANGSSDSEYALGGFFGAPGNDGLFRICSGNAAFHEPNLTPITERSEYSTRSSFVLPHMTTATHPAVQSLQNYGLAQLAARMGSSVDDLSLANLQKLRRSAWSGSNTSLGSADSLGAASLPSRLPPLPHSTPGFSMSTSRLSLTGTGDASSCYGSSSDGYRSAPASPTLTQLDPPLQQSDTLGANAPSSPDEELTQPSNISEHKTESVRYVKEEDSFGQTRWIVERLRRLGSGKVEVLGREVVSGGRI